MLTLNDALVIEGETESDELGYYQSVQRAINGGCWSFQGSYGRTMMAAIQEGRCLLGKGFCLDAYNNRIPSRGDVQEGTLGSRQYVVDRMGEDWAAAMEGV